MFRLGLSHQRPQPKVADAEVADLLAWLKARQRRCATLKGWQEGAVAYAQRASVVERLASRVEVLESAPSERETTIKAWEMAAGLLDGIATAAAYAKIFGRHSEAYNAAATTLLNLVRQGKRGEEIKDRNGLTFLAALHPTARPETEDTKR